MADLHEDGIPNFAKDSQIYKYAINEVNYKKEILQDINYIIGNFNFDSDSYYILTLFTQWFRLPLQANATLEFLRQQLQSVIQALKTAGTHESFKTLFQAFLGVNVNITLDSGMAGTIVIQLLEFPRFNRYLTVLGSDGTTGFLIQKPNLEFVPLAVGEADNDFIDNFYLFVKSLIPAGRILTIRDPSVLPQWDGDFLWDQDLPELFWA